MHWKTLLFTCISVNSVFSDVVNNLPKWSSVLTDSTSLEENLIPLFGVSHPWYLYDADHKYYPATNVTLPSDLITDLMKNGTIDDPYYDRNFLTQQHVWLGRQKQEEAASHRQRTRTWIYQTNFTLTNNISSKILVIEGIKMGAYVEVNGAVIGEPVTDQFLRYLFPLDPAVLEKGQLLSTGSSVHSVRLIFDPAINTDGRFMACSGGWDWAPYTRANDGRGSRIFTLGVVKPIYIASIHQFYISRFSPIVYSVNTLDPKRGFRVSVTVVAHRLPDAPQQFSIVLRSTFSDNTLRQILFRPGELKKEVVIVFPVSQDNIDLWWPNGMGEQPLYPIQISINSSTPVWQTKQIGFRTAALVTTETIVTNSESEGSGSNGMLLMINGFPVFVKGANVVPMDELEGRWTDDAHCSLVKSAADANMNILRIWGGGAVLPFEFYETCDELGILLYHDLLFVGEQNHSAFDLPQIRAEVEHVVSSLAAHPSIVLWSGCNECTYFGGNMSIYEDAIFPHVSAVDKSRIVWPSSPSNFGWSQGVHTQDGTPNGNLFRVKLEGNHTLESHGPYQRGVSSSYPAVNGLVSDDTYETNIPANLSSLECIDTSCEHTFHSEFGSSVFSSFESMSAFLRPQDWGIHGGSPPDICEHTTGDEYDCVGENPLAERNYPCDSRMDTFFGPTGLDDLGKEAFQQQLYLCMISQSIWMKSTIESLRQTNTFGLLIWQLNDIWPTGGWSAIEYGPSNDREGHLPGGRWKPLLFLIRDHLFNDIIVACGMGGRCYARNDGKDSSEIIVRFQQIIVEEDSLQRTFTMTIHLRRGPGSIHRFALPNSMLNDRTDGIYIRVFTGEFRISENVALLRIPKDIAGIERPTSVRLSLELVGGMSWSIRLKSDSILLFVVVSSSIPGSFSHNAFFLQPTVEKEVIFRATIDVNADNLANSLSLHHLGSAYSACTLNIQHSMHETNSILALGHTLSHIS